MCCFRAKQWWEKPIFLRSGGRFPPVPLSTRENPGMTGKLDKKQYCFSRTVKKLLTYMSHFTITLVTKFLKVVEIFTLKSLYIHNLLLCCCNTETNTGPKCFSLLFCHWDLNGVTAKNFHKSLLQSYITQHDFD